MGHIAHIGDVVGFHTDNIADLHIAFEQAVDDYLSYYVEQGREPQRVVNCYPS